MKGMRIWSEDVADIISMRKKDGDETVKPLIKECKSEYYKYMVLRNKAELRGRRIHEFYRTGFVER